MKNPCAITVDLAIMSDGWLALGVEEALAALVEKVLSTAAHHAGQPLPELCAVSVLLTDDSEMAALNQHWRRQNKPTNVLSFENKGFATQVLPPNEPPCLGDIALGFETCAREAGEESKTLHDHVCHLFVHGFLHLLGHDHEREDEALLMENLERAILAKLNIQDPYQDNQEPAIMVSQN